MEPTSRSPAWPRLSERLNPFKNRKTCQKCGRKEGDITPVQKTFPGINELLMGQNRADKTKLGHVMTVYPWVEHDHNDKPEPIYVFLCTKCSNELIEPHVRLYRQGQKFEPLPGIMDICADCKWREMSRCKCPAATFNGGPDPGLKFEGPTPSVCFVDGTRKGKRWGGRMLIYHGPTTACSGKEAKA